MEASLWRRGCATLATASCSAAQSNKSLFALSAGFLLLLIVYSDSISNLSITEERYHHHLVMQKERDIVMNSKTISKVSRKSGVHDYSFSVKESTNGTYLKLDNTSGNAMKNTVIKRSETMHVKVKDVQKIDTEYVNSQGIQQPTTTSAAATPTTTTTTTNIKHPAITTTAAAPSSTAEHSAITTTSLALKQQNQSRETRKTILFITKFFSKSWESFLGKETLLPPMCPVTNCDILFNTSHPEDADAIIFHWPDINKESLPKVRRRGQLYIWFNMEAPLPNNNDNVLYRLMRQFKSVRKMEQQENRRVFGFPGFFNWTFTYHRDSDLLLLYGGLWPKHGHGNVLKPGLLDTSDITYKNYVAALDRGDVLQDDKQQEWAAFLERPKLAVWMASHCSTSSGREFYIRELQQHIQVDVFGACGDLKCGKSHNDVECYSDLLRPNYKFYMAFENSLCEDYITEKVWLPMKYGLVPVVYGGARYADFLPPHSYVDATHLTPRQLSRVLSRIGGSPELYERYHLWRKYWRVLHKPPLCELCYKLHHRNHKEPAVSRGDLSTWWWRVNNCTTHYPPDRYPRPSKPDTRPFTQKVKDAFGILKWTGR
ncbi:alpha-(1,3)-fucosyltransferase C-like [Portunus trituberculatus]|uniref:alpha-(1,3)-fucosyltransferase C-like n=1 Tax=Portunus trituberculatus TaxID=210409 RepID=UPI001E1CCF5C|nr:alpha-(1,3)-fucosyltransferase C-like [Portunus trituberculatus]